MDATSEELFKGINIMKINDIKYCPKCGSKLNNDNGIGYCPNSKCDIVDNLTIKKPRDSWELWIDRHNHKFELIRTIGNFLTGLVALLVILGIHV